MRDQMRSTARPPKPVSPGRLRPARPANGELRRPRATPAVAALAVALALLLLPAASPAATTIGSGLGGDANANIPACAGLCTFSQISLAAPNQAAAGLASPIDGVVVRWRLKAGSAGGAVNLRVLRPTGPASYQGAGRGETQVAQIGTNTWATRLPLRAGDRLGLDNASEGLFFANPGAGLVFYWSPGLAEGESRVRTATANYELMLNGDVEPDADRDAFGDETQDQCPTNASTQGACPVANPTGQRARARRTCRRRYRRDVRRVGRRAAKKKLRRCYRRGNRRPL